MVTLVPRRFRGPRLRDAARAAAPWLLVACSSVTATAMYVHEATRRDTCARQTRASSPSPYGLAGAPGERPDERALEVRVLGLVNGERTRRGLAPLDRVPELDTAARANTERMAGSAEMRHSPPGTLQQVPIRWRALGENVGAATTVEEVHRLMMGSRRHRANILRSTFDAVGIAVAYGDDRRCYVTEVFASRAR